MKTEVCSTLSELREKLGKFNGTPLQKEFLECDSVSGGIPRGVICEIMGSARTEWVLRLLKQNSHLTTFWAEEKLTVFPTAIQQRGVDLDRILMAEVHENLFPALRKALKSRLFDCVVLPGVIEEVKVLKALQLFARESNTCVFFLSEKVRNAWAIPFQIQVEWMPGMELILTQVLKSKFSQERQA